MGAVLTRQWKLGTLVFLIVLVLCLISIWQRQIRYNLIFAFSVHTITNHVQLPSLSAVNSDNITRQIRRAVENAHARTTVDHHEGAFRVTVLSISARSTDDIQRQLSAAYEELTEKLRKGIDTAPLASKLASLDTRLDLIDQTQRSTALSTYDQYALKDRALALNAERDEVRKQLEIASGEVFSAPSTELHPAEHLDGAVLVVLGLVLSAFVAATMMVLADLLGRISPAPVVERP